LQELAKRWSEADSMIVKICGYSWGGVSAIGFTQKIATAGVIVVGGSPKNPIQYRLEVGIIVAKLAAVDPVAILNQPRTVQTNVESFYNWYQQRGGGSLFGP